MSFNINDKMDITVKVMTKEDKKKKVKDKKAKNTDSLQLKDKTASLIESPDQLEAWKKQLIFIQRVGVNLSGSQNIVKNILWQMDNE